MRRVPSLVNRRLDDTARSWQRWRLARHAAVLGSALAIAVLLVGVLAVLGWLGSEATAWLLLGAAAVVGLFAGVVSLVLTLGVDPDRREMAAALEHAQAPLLDRLNTLVHVEQTGADLDPAIRRQLELETSAVLRQSDERSPFAKRRPLLHWLTFAMLLMGTVLFYRQFTPFERLRAADLTMIPDAVDALEIPERAADGAKPQAVDAEQPWGEVRITAPGRDERITKLETRPLRIEAAANRDLEAVEWVTTTGDEPPQIHALSPQADPKYAVYQRELKPEDFGLEEWDVLRYFARARSRDGEEWTSDVYFLEVVPLREELDKLPGGTEGTAYRMLGDLTDLVGRQQTVLKHEHRLSVAPVPDRARHLAKLAEHEAALRQRLEHLAAELRSRGSDEAEPLLDALREAGRALDTAERSLKDDDLERAAHDSQHALSALAGLRKELQDLAEQHPEALVPAEELAKADDAESLQKTDVPRSTAERVEELVKRSDEIQQDAAMPDKQPSAKQVRELADELQRLVKEDPELLKQLEERSRELAETLRESADQLDAEDPEAREHLDAAMDELDGLAAEMQQQLDEQNRAETQRELAEMEEREEQLADARQEVQKLLLEERNLERQTNPRQQQQMPKLAEQQQKLNDALDQLREQNPQPFEPKECNGQCDGTQAAMQQAKNSLQSGAGTSRQRVAEAADELQRLDSALEQHGQQQSLADAYKLREKLEQQIRELDRMAKQCDQPGQAPGQSAAEQAAENARQTAQKLQQAAEQSGDGDGLGESLKKAFEEGTGQKIGEQAGKLGEAKSPGERGQAAGGLRDQLRQLARAFDRGQPNGPPRWQPGNSLQDSGHDALARALRQLDSLKRQPPGRLSEDQQRQLRHEATENLAEGVSDAYGDNDRTREAVDRLRRDLEDPKIPVNLRVVEELLRQISGDRSEQPTADTSRPDPAELLQVDPSRVSPPYRSAVEKYFEKLSEQR